MSSLVISILPLLFFIIFDLSHPHIGLYVGGLFTGSTHVSIDVSKNQFNIVGNNFYGLYQFNLAYVVLLCISFFVFIASLFFLGKTITRMQKLEAVNTFDALTKI